MVYTGHAMSVVEQIANISALPRMSAVGGIGTPMIGKRKDHTRGGLRFYPPE
jgi:hypothetical protein